MLRLGVNIDHVATLRQARGGREPDPVWAAVLDMPAILPQVNGDPVRAAQFRQHSGPDRVGLAPAARLTQRGDVVDIHSESRNHENLIACNFQWTA